MACFGLLAGLQGGTGRGQTGVPAAVPVGVPGPTLTGAAIEQYIEEEEANRFEIGASAMFLVPRYESNLAFTATQIRPAVPGYVPIGTTGRQFQEFSYKMAAAPRVWLGMRLWDNIGARVSWWSYDQSATPKEVVNGPIPLGSPVGANLVQSASPLMAISSATMLPGVTSVQVQGSGAPADRLRFTNNLTFNVWDFDATYDDLKVGRAELTLFGGLRYAHLTQSYDVVSQGAVAQTLVSSQSFNGVGPSGGVMAHLPVTDNGLALYGNGRIGFLFGEDRHESQGQALGLIPPYTLGAFQDESGRQRFLPTFDLEFGAEYARELANGGKWFTRVGVMGQVWPVGSGSSGNGNLGLLGLVLSTGFDF